MASTDSDVIKEFLVELGFKLDKNQMNQWNSWMGVATKTAVGFGLAAAAAAATVVGFVEKVSSGLDDLYWASQRIRAGVGNIEGFEYAIVNMGGSVQGALGSLEGLASFMRSNPGAEGFLASLGINTRGANGEMLDRVKVMDQLAQRFKQMPFYIAKAYASFMGIDEMTLMAMERGTGQFGNRYNSLYAAAGMNADQAAAGAHQFMVSMRGIQAQFTVLAQIIATRLNPLALRLAGAVGAALDGFLGWLGTPEAAHLGGAIEQLGGSLWTLMKSAGDLAAKFLKFLNLGSMDRLSQIINSLAGTLEALNDILTGNWGDLKKHLKQAATDTFTYLADTWQKWGGDISPHTSAQNARAQAVDAFRKMGWSASQAAGIVANLSWESGLKPGATGDNGSAHGVAQWHSNRIAGFNKWASAKGYPAFNKSSLAEQYAFVNYELTQGAEKHAGALLRATQSAYAAAGVVSKFYERPAAVDSNMVLRGNLANQIFSASVGAGKHNSIEINQKNETHIHTQDNPQAIKRANEQAHKRTNGDLLRNLKGAAR